VAFVVCFVCVFLFVCFISPELLDLWPSHKWSGS